MSLIIGYARTSTDRQSTDLQIDALKAAGAQRIYQEAMSGARRDRKELARALEVARAGDVLLVYSLSRLSRSVRDLTDVAADLERRGVELRSLRENLDTCSPGGRLAFHVFASVAQFERELLAERVKDGLIAAKKRGRVGGRPPAMTPERVRAGRAMLLAQEMTCPEIAAQLGVSLSSLYRAFPSARAGAKQGQWEPPKLARIPPELAPAET